MSPSATGVLSNDPSVELRRGRPLAQRFGGPRADLAAAIQPGQQQWYFTGALIELAREETSTAPPLLEPGPLRPVQGWATARETGAELAGQPGRCGEVPNRAGPCRFARTNGRERQRDRGGARCRRWMISGGAEGVEQRWASTGYYYCERRRLIILRRIVITGGTARACRHICVCV